MNMNNNQENDKLLKEIQNKEKILLNELNRIDNSSIDTVSNLKRQGEQLERVKKNTNVISENVSLPEKIVQKMKGISYLFLNKSKLEDKIEENNEKKVNNVNNDKNSNYQYSFLNIFRKSETNKVDNEKKIDSLDLMINQLEKIKTNVKNQQELLKQQNSTLDEVIDETEKTNLKIKQLNKKIKKIN